MIKTFGDKNTEKVFNGMRVKIFSPKLAKAAGRKLDMIDSVNKVNDLRIPPNNQLEKLSGNLKGFWSIRINKQYRIIFRWNGGDAYDVSIMDYH